MNWLLLNSIISASITLLFGLVFLALYLHRTDLHPSRYWGISYIMLMIAMATTGVRMLFPDLNPYFLSSLLASSAGLGCFYLYCGIRIWRQSAPLTDKTRALVVIPLVAMSLTTSFVTTLEPVILIWARIYIGGFTSMAIYALLTGSQPRHTGHYVTACFLAGIPVSQVLSAYLIASGSWGPDGIAAVSLQALLSSPLAIINFIGLPIAFTGIGLFCLLGLLLEFSTRLYEESIRDWLTGCYNRRGFIELADKVFHQSRRQNDSLSLVLIDMDDFKVINDNHGHDVGDTALQLTAKVLGERLRASDVLARWGGEEFIVLLPNTSEDRAALVAESLREQIANQTLLLGNGHEHQLTASFGVSSLRRGDKSLDAIVTRADVALYQAKSAGKNRVTPATINAA